MKTCDLDMLFVPQCDIDCAQERSLCKSKNGSIFQTEPGLFKDRFQSCRKFNAEFCKFDLSVQSIAKTIRPKYLAGVFLKKK